MRLPRVRSICPAETDCAQLSSCCCCCCCFGCCAVCNYVRCSWQCYICGPKQYPPFATSQIYCIACHRNLPPEQLTPRSSTSPLPVEAVKRSFCIDRSVEDHLSVSSPSVGEPRRNCVVDQKNSDLIKGKATFATHKQAMRLLHAMNELLQTERDYVADLTHLVEICFKALAHQDWISNEDKLTIFRNADEILQFHKRFLAALESQAAGNSKCQHIAKVFLKMGSQFQLYTTYCERHGDAWALCASYREQVEWAVFLKECASPTLPDMSTDLAFVPPINKRLHFEDYLIKPVQRICRYQLLIKEIACHIPPGSHDAYELNDALDRMQKIVSDIDRQKNIRDISERTYRFFQRLEGDWRLNKRHATKLGKLVISGALEVTYTALGQSIAKSRYLGCFVFPAYFVLVRPKKSTVYEPKHWFPLKFAELEDLQDIEGRNENAFVIRCKKHVFSFSASCTQEKLLWIKKLEQVINDTRHDDENTSSAVTLDLEDIIVPSLPGVGIRQNRYNSVYPSSGLRVSRSFTNILDIAIASGTLSAETSTATAKNLLRRSMSSTVTTKKGSVDAKDDLKLPSNALQTDGTLPASLGKRYLVDFQAHQKCTGKGKREIEYVEKPSIDKLEPITRRPSSMDLFTSGNISANVIGKMSSQLKSNHQNAIRMAVDHKLRDVCTQDYLSSRAWWARDKKEALATGSLHSSKKRKSTSFLRASVSSFSVLQTKKPIEIDRSITYNERTQDFEILSTSSTGSVTEVGKIMLSLDRISQMDKVEHKNRRDLLENDYDITTVQRMPFDGASILATHTERDSALSLSCLLKESTDPEQNASLTNTQIDSDPAMTRVSINRTTPRLSTGKVFMGKILCKISNTSKESAQTGNHPRTHEAGSARNHSDLPNESIAQSERVRRTQQFACSNPSLYFSDLNNPTTCTESDGRHKVKPKSSVLRWKNRNNASNHIPTELSQIDPDTMKNVEEQHSVAFAYASTPKQPHPKPSIQNIFKLKFVKGKLKKR